MQETEILNSAAGEGMCMSQGRLLGGDDFWAGFKRLSRACSKERHFGRGSSLIKGAMNGIFFFFLVHPDALFLFLDKTFWGIPSPVCGTVLVELPESWNLSLRQLSPPRAVELSCPEIWFFSPVIAKKENSCCRALKILFIPTELVPDLLWFSTFLLVL